jgi:hypothetical protein
VLIDWIPATHFAHEELDQLEILARHLLAGVEAGTVALTLLDGSGKGRVFDHGSRRRFWRRVSPLSAQLPGPSES